MSARRALSIISHTLSSLASAHKRLRVCSGIPQIPRTGLDYLCEHIQGPPDPPASDTAPRRPGWTVPSAPVPDSVQPRPSWAAVGWQEAVCSPLSDVWSKTAQADAHPSCPFLGQHSPRVAGLPGWGAGDFLSGRVAPAMGKKSQPQTDNTGDSAPLKSELGESPGPGPEPFTRGAICMCV